MPDRRKALEGARCDARAHTGGPRRVGRVAPGFQRLVRRGALVALAGALGAASSAWAEPCVDAVVEYIEGTNGGFQSELLPEIVMGPPFGEGTENGSLDVASLGDDGSITVAFEDNVIIDGPGPDFTIFENPFGDGVSQPTFVEAGVVSASADGVTFVEFPHQVLDFVGLAGVTPVLSRPGNGIDPRDPTVSGGDAFDLADIGLAEARFIRIDDPGVAVPDAGNAFPLNGPGESGFDLDAIVAVNSMDTCAACCDLDANGVVTPGDVLLLLRDLLAQPPSIAPCGGPPCRSVHCGDTNDDFKIGPADVLLCQQLASELTPAIDPCRTGQCDY